MKKREGIDPKGSPPTSLTPGEGGGEDIYFTFIRHPSCADLKKTFQRCGSIPDVCVLTYGQHAGGGGGDADWGFGADIKAQLK